MTVRIPHNLTPPDRCNHAWTVLESEVNASGHKRRRYGCKKCGKRQSSVEIMIPGNYGPGRGVTIEDQLAAQILGITTESLKILQNLLKTL